MNTKKVSGQIICNIIALAGSSFYLILAVAYIGYMIYLVAAEVKMGIVLLVDGMMFLIAFGSKANEQLLGNINEGVAGFIFFFVLAFSLIPVIARIVVGIVFAFSNLKE